jgi:large subunit ribosomal protein L29
MVLKAKDIRELNSEERMDKLKELKEELMHERGVAAMGGSPPSPGKIRQIRMTIAKLLTIMREEGEIK